MNNIHQDVKMKWFPKYINFPIGNNCNNFVTRMQYWASILFVIWHARCWLGFCFSKCLPRLSQQSYAESEYPKLSKYWYISSAKYTASSGTAPAAATAGPEAGAQATLLAQPQHSARCAISCAAAGELATWLESCIPTHSCDNICVQASTWLCAVVQDLFAPDLIFRQRQCPQMLLLVIKLPKSRVDVEHIAAAFPNKFLKHILVWGLKEKLK